MDAELEQLRANLPEEKQKLFDEGLAQLRQKMKEREEERKAEELRGVKDSLASQVEDARAALREDLDALIHYESAWLYALRGILISPQGAPSEVVRIVQDAEELIELVKRVEGALEKFDSLTYEDTQDPEVMSEIREYARPHDLSPRVQDLIERMGAKVDSLHVTTR